ncbi:hypothetical protein B5F87_02185 [Eubacterium sp. An3]|nr:hypothetical protein B5F87_02185 [Eubacterium sp. An3]
MRTERTKQDKLLAKGKRVDRYILAIADNITVRKKDEIYQLMSPYIVSTDDILMKEDLNNLLSQKEYREVEDKYYQLWIPSANILRKQLFRMVNSALVQKSITCYEEILKRERFLLKRPFLKMQSCSCERTGLLLFPESRVSVKPLWHSSFPYTIMSNITFRRF